MILSYITKASLDKCFRVFLSKEDVLIEEDPSARQQIVLDFKTYLKQHDFSELLEQKWETLEEHKASHEQKFLEYNKANNSDHKYRYYHKSTLSQKEYMEQYFYSQLEEKYSAEQKYLPTIEKAKEVFFARLGYPGRLLLFIAVQFNERNELIVEWNYCLGSRWRNDFNLKSGTITSTATSIPQLQKFFSSLKAENEKDQEKKRIASEDRKLMGVKKDKVKKLKSKAALSTIKQMLEEMEIETKVQEHVRDFRVFIPMKKKRGCTEIKISKKDVKEGLDTLKETILMIQRADEKGIVIRYHQ